MIRDEWQTWVYMLLVLGVVLLTVALFGCAEHEPPTPISYYRAAYGFTP